MHVFFRLTLILTHDCILFESGSLSAAAVAKIGTHSVSGARHRRHPPLRILLRISSFMFEKFYFTNKIHALNRKKLNNKKNNEKNKMRLQLFLSLFLNTLVSALITFQKCQLVHLERLNHRCVVAIELILSICFTHLPNTLAIYRRNLCRPLQVCVFLLTFYFCSMVSIMFSCGSF